jgi:hypothetical protein
MGRKRAPQHDWICIRCGCPCEADGSRHLGGGQGMRSCKKSPRPMLRAEFEEMIRADLRSAFSREELPH